MKESLAGRVGRIISGSLNALVDAVENAAPEVVMQEAIREIDGAIEDVRGELGRVLAQKHQAGKRLLEENQRHEQIGQQLAVAVASGRDDLAEAGIAAQMDIEAQIPVLENSLADCGAREQELEGYIKALQAKKRDMKTELTEFRKAQQAQQTGPTESGQGQVERAANKADAAFERVMAAATGLPGRSGRDAKSASQLAELEELARKNRIQERLAALKAK